MKEKKELMILAISQRSLLSIRISMKIDILNEKN